MATFIDCILPRTHLVKNSRSHNGDTPSCLCCAGTARFQAPQSCALEEPKVEYGMMGKATPVFLISCPISVPILLEYPSQDEHGSGFTAVVLVSYGSTSTYTHAIFGSISGLRVGRRGTKRIL